MVSTGKVSKVAPVIFAIAGVFLFAATGYAQMGGGGHMGGGTGGSGSGSGTGMGGGLDMGNMPNGMGGMMLVSGGNPYRSDGRLVQIEDANNIAAQYLSRLAIAGLALDRVEEWEFNYCAIIKEVAPSEYKAFELLIDKWTGSVTPGAGPDMAWNQKYGRLMNAMMENGSGHMSRRERRMTQPDVTVDAAAAADAARQFLSQRFTRPLALSGAADKFYGYYSFDVNDEKGARYGRLTVNGVTGQVWYHTWHGSFVR